MLDLFSFDVYELFLKRTPSLFRRFEALLQRLPRNPNSAYRATLLDELSQQPPSEERDEQIDQMRFLGWSHESYKLAEIVDAINILSRNVVSLAGGGDDLGKFIPSSRPLLHPDGHDDAPAEDEEVVDFFSGGLQSRVASM